MSDKVRINWTLKVQVAEGPRMSVSKSVAVQAYDKINVVIEDGASGQEVQVQPGGEGQVQFLLIGSDYYGADLSYSVNAPEAASEDRTKLDALQLFVGDGAVGLLDSSPETLYFYNGLGEAASITILVGRKAIPST